VPEQDERTERATGRRRNEARQDGRVAKSADLTSGLGLIMALIALASFGPGLGMAIRKMIAEFVGKRIGMELSPNNVQELVLSVVGPVALMLAPMIVLMMVAGILVSLLQVGWVITPKALEPKWDKLNVVQGLTKLISFQSVGTMLVGLLKLAAVGWIAYSYISARMDMFMQLNHLQHTDFLLHLGSLVLGLGWRVAAAMIAIGALDYAFQKYQFEKSIRMTKQEVKEERKQDDGDPQVKSRVKQIQRQMAFQRMMQAVPDASVVVTNPTHVSVALKYEPDVDAAPRVVAMGPNLIAFKIRKLAEKHGIPIYEDPPLARSLLRNSTVGREIPPQFYRAVAQVLAFVLRQKNRAAYAARTATPSPALAGGGD